MKNYLIIVVILGLNFLAFAHDGEEQTGQPEIVPSSQFETINADYVKSIKPIFQKKCFDCHSNQTVYPWYYKIPGVSHLIDYDIKEAREHLDMSFDFPFKGHGLPANDLQEIAKEISGGDMPPLQYRLIHRDSAITESEKKQVLEWIEKSRELLK